MVNEGHKANSPDVKLTRDDRPKKEVKNTRLEEMTFYKDGKKRKKVWRITEYKDGSIGKQIDHVEIVR